MHDGLSERGTTRSPVKTLMIIAVMYTTGAAVKINPVKNSGLYGIRAHDLCDTGAVLYQLSDQANWDLAALSS